MTIEQSSPKIRHPIEWTCVFHWARALTLVSLTLGTALAIDLYAVATLAVDVPSWIILSSLASAGIIVKATGPFVWRQVQRDNRRWAALLLVGMIGLAMLQSIYFGVIFHETIFGGTAANPGAVLIARMIDRALGYRAVDPRTVLDVLVIVGSLFAQCCAVLFPYVYLPVRGGAINRFERHDEPTPLAMAWNHGIADGTISDVAADCPRQRTAPPPASSRVTNVDAADSPHIQPGCSDSPQHRTAAAANGEWPRKGPASFESAMALVPLHGQTFDPHLTVAEFVERFVIFDPAHTEPVSMLFEAFHMLVGPTAGANSTNFGIALRKAVGARGHRTKHSRGFIQYHGLKLNSEGRALLEVRVTLPQRGGCLTLREQAEPRPDNRCRSVGLHHRAPRTVGVCAHVARRGPRRHAKAAQIGDIVLLDQQLASKTTGVLDQHYTHALDLIQRPPKPGRTRKKSAPETRPQ